MRTAARSTPSAPLLRPASRRGAVGIAVIALLVIVQLVIVAAVIAGARDQDMTVQRMDTLRSFYACESGANMSIRELCRGVDEDGDGKIGGISDDGNAANDPSLSGARFTSVWNSVGATTTIAPTGRSGATYRKASVVVEGGPGTALQGNLVTMATWSKGSSRIPRYSIYSAGAWSAAASLPWSSPSDVISVHVLASPTRNEIMFGCDNSGKDLLACMYNGTSWGAVTTLATNVAREKDRPYDFAYEHASGRGMVAYWNDTVGEFCYRIWNGTSWSAQTVMSASGTDHSHFLSLTAKYNSNEIMLLANDHRGSSRLLANVWSGSSWSGWTVFENTLPAPDVECFAGAYESISGDGLVVYSESGQDNPRYRTWNGASWSSEGSLPTIGRNPLWVRLPSDPASDTIVCAMSDQDRDVEANVWSGSSWGSNLRFTTDQGATSPRMFDGCFEPSSGRCLVVYRNNAKNYPVYRTWNGTSWSAEANGPNINRDGIFIKLTPGFLSGEVFVSYTDSSHDLHQFRWNGTSLSADTVLETSLADAQEPANNVAAPIVWRLTRIMGWTEVAPQ